METMKQETLSRLKGAGMAVPPELAEHIPGYMSRREEDLTAMWNHFGKNEFAAIGRIAHKIKGNGASYGFSALSEIAEKLQSSSASSDRAAVEKDIQALDREIRMIKALMS